MTDNLAELKDIHLPDDIWMFPLGWASVTFFVLMFCLLIFSPFLYKLWRQNKKRYALKMLENIKTKDVSGVARISELLRRICILKYPDAVALFGDKWLSFLKKHNKSALSKSQKNLLCQAPYMPQDKAVLNEDFDAIKAFAHSFLEDNL